MENNHILIGLVVLTVSCIYLFYLNFQKHQEFEQLHVEVKKLKLLNSLTQNKLMEIASSKKNNVGSLTKKNLENLDVEIEKNKLEDLFNDNQQSEEPEEQGEEDKKQDLDLNLSADEIEEINDLEETDLDDNEENLVIEENDLNLNEENLVIEEVSLENNDLEKDEVVDLEESKLDDLELELDVEVVNNEENLEEEKEEKEEKNTVEIENLDSMTLKELKVVAKNMNIKTKGNKDELINKIKNKISN